MKRRVIVSMAAILAPVFVVGITVAAQPTIATVANLARLL